MKKQLFVGLDVGGTKCATVIGTAQGEILERLAFASGAQTPPSEILTHFDQDIRFLLEKHHGGKPPLAFGVSCGGPLDCVRGVVQCPPNLPLWDEVEICAHLSRGFGAPAWLQNDANACAIAEWRFGAGQGVRHMIFLTFGTGLGAGLILNGKLYSGACGMAGEVGHIRLAQDGPMGYGKHGSYEGFCSGGGIQRLWQRYLREKREQGEAIPLAAQWPVPEDMATRDICEAAANGDKDALAVIEESASYLGKGLAVLVDVLNPECIVIGSVFARAQALFHTAMQRELQKEALAQSVQSCRVKPSALGDRLGDVAALTVAIEGHRAMMA